MHGERPGGPEDRLVGVHRGLERGEQPGRTAIHGGRDDVDAIAGDDDRRSAAGGDGQFEPVRVRVASALFA